MIDDVSKASEDDLLRQAVAVVRTRYEFGNGYPGVSQAEAADMAAALEAATDTPDGAGGVEREEAVALAHRLVDDDQPETSPLWPRTHG